MLIFSVLPNFIKIHIALGFFNFVFYVCGIALKIFAIFGIFASFSSNDQVVYFGFSFSVDDLRLGGIMLWAIGFVVQNGRRLFVTQLFIPALKNKDAVDTINASLGVSYLKRGQERMIVRLSLGVFLLLSAISILLILAWIQESYFSFSFAIAMIFGVELLLNYSGEVLKKIKVNFTRSNISYLLVGVWGLISGLISAVAGLFLFAFDLGESMFGGFLVSTAIFIAACQLISLLGSYKLHV